MTVEAFNSRGSINALNTSNRPAQPHSRRNTNSLRRTEGQIMFYFSQNYLLRRFGTRTPDAQTIRNLVIEASRSFDR